MDPEFLKALDLVAEYDRTRPIFKKECRLYYNETGTIIGLWEIDHPAGNNYIVLDNSDVFYNNNTSLLKVIGKKLKVIDPIIPAKIQLVKSATGHRVVAGHASIVLYPMEEHTEIEYYDRHN